MVSYLKVGENIAQHITSKARSTMIEFNKKGLQALKKSEISADIEQAIDNILETNKSPRLIFTANDTQKHIILSMVTKDGDEIITQKPYILQKGTNIRDIIPATTGMKTTISLDKTGIEELISKDDDFAQYLYNIINGNTTSKTENNFIMFFHNEELSTDVPAILKEYISKVKNPRLDISTKHGDKYDISAFKLMDDDNIVAQGAYSEAKNSMGKCVRKYHISTERYQVNGFNGSGKFFSKETLNISNKLRKTFEVLGEYLMNGRSNLMLKYKFGLAGYPVRTSSNIGELFGLTSERVNYVINKAISKLIKRPASDEEIKLYERTKIISKYLTEEEKEHFLAAKRDSIYKHESDNISDFIELSEMRARKAAYDVIHDIQKP